MTRLLPAVLVASVAVVACDLGGAAAGYRERYCQELCAHDAGDAAACVEACVASDAGTTGGGGGAEEDGGTGGGATGGGTGGGSTGGGTGGGATGGGTGGGAMGGGTGGGAMGGGTGGGSTGGGTGGGAMGGGTGGGSTGGGTGGGAMTGGGTGGGSVGGGTGGGSVGGGAGGGSVGGGTGGGSVGGGTGGGAVGGGTGGGGPVSPCTDPAQLYMVGSGMGASAGACEQLWLYRTSSVPGCSSQVTLSSDAGTLVQFAPNQQACSQAGGTPVLLLTVGDSSGSAWVRSSAFGPIGLVATDSSPVGVSSTTENFAANIVLSTPGDQVAKGQCVQGTASALTPGGAPVPALVGTTMTIATSTINTGYGAVEVYGSASCNDAGPGTVTFAPDASTAIISVRGVLIGDAYVEAQGTFAAPGVDSHLHVVTADGGACLGAGEACSDPYECCNGMCSGTCIP